MKKKIFIKGKHFSGTPEGKTLHSSASTGRAQTQK